MSRPVYCPSYAANLPGGDSGAMPLGEGERSYDCYCGSRGWSGDISPDDEN